MYQSNPPMLSLTFRVSLKPARRAKYEATEEFLLYNSPITESRKVDFSILEKIKWKNQLSDFQCNPKACTTNFDIKK